MRRAGLCLIMSVVLVAQVITGKPLYASASASANLSEALEAPEIDQAESTISGQAVATRPVVAVQEAPIPLAPGEIIITGYYLAGRQLGYVELYNKSSSLVSLDGWQLTVRVMVDGRLEAISQQLTGYIRAKQHLLIAGDNVTTERDLALALPTDLPVPVQLTVGVPGVSETATRSMVFADGVTYNLRQVSTGYTTANDFLTTAVTPTYGGWYAPAESTPLAVREIFANTRACAPGEDAADCREFVEVCNTGDTPVALDLYRLRLGAGNTGASLANTVPLSGGLDGGDCRAIDRRSDGAWLDVPASGSAWLEDAYGVKTYLETAVTYAGLSQAARDGQSWAYDAAAGAWRWAWPTPVSAINDFDVPGPVATSSELAPCKPGQYRSEETNRCRNIEAASAPTPCREGQYRSEETGRCRSIAAAASAAKSCADDQFRNPETGRCKKIASTDDLAPCKPGQERNPDTNRCRNISVSDMPKAGFAPTPIDASGRSFVAWWALGGVLVLGIGYAVWEWRYEIRKWLGARFGNLVSRGK